MLIAPKTGWLYIFVIITFFVTHTIHSQNQFPKPKFKARSTGVPATPDEIKITEPDGGTVNAHIKGDGAVHWYQTKEGYTILKDKSGFYEYAVSDKKGNLKSSGFKVNNRLKSKSEELNFLSKTTKDLRYSKSQAETLKNNYLPASSNEPSKAFPANGTSNLLLILIDFPDKPHTYPLSNFESLMNHPGYNGTGSFKDYYSANSFGQLNITTTVTGWYTASHNHDYYCDECSQDNSNTTYRELVREAVDAAEANGVDFSIYDNDGDGVVDGVMIIHQGEGAERGDLTNVWSHSWQLNPGGSYSNLSVTYDGVLINDYTLNPETSSGGMGAIGVLCHEFGHNLGLPDYYDTEQYLLGGENFHLGEWDCMASGSYNNGSATPANHNSYSRNMLGWQTAIELISPTSIELPNIAQNNISYFYSTKTPNEYFWLENRQKISGTFDQYIPSHGLLIYHIDLNNSGWLNNSVNTSSNNAMDIEEADDMKSYSTISGDPFPGSTGNTSFTDYSIPNSFSVSGETTVKPITNIKELSGTITFDFKGGDNNLVENFKAETKSTTQIDLSWNSNLNLNEYPILIAWSVDGIFGNPVNGVAYNPGSNISGGGTVLYLGNSESFNHNSLTPNTTYHYKAWLNIGNNNYSQGTFASANTSCPSVNVLPINIDFDDGSFPECWSQEFGPSTWEIANGNRPLHSQDAHSGEYNLLFYYNTDGPNKKNKFISPAINLSGVSNPTLKFWHTQKVYSDGSQDKLRIYYKTSHDGQWNLITSYINDIPEWTAETISLPNPSSEYYIAFEGDAQWGYGVCLDDISIYSACSPPTKQASYFSVSNLSSNSTTIGWNRGNGNNVLVIARAGKAVNEYPMDGLSYTANANFGSGQQIGTENYVVYNGAGNSVNITGLLSGVDYRFDIYEYNNVTKCYLCPSLKGHASTYCTPISFPYIINFENGGKIPDCWTQEDGPPVWINRYYDPILGQLNPPAPHGGSYYIRLEDYSTASNKNKFISPSLNLTSVSKPALKFWHMQAWNLPEYESGWGQDELRIYYKTSVNAAWNLLTTYTNSITNWISDTIYLPNPSEDYYIAFEGDAKYGDGVCIDDISIYSECAPSVPSSNSITYGITSNSMIVDWTRGNGNKVLVIARAGSPVNIPPVNGTSYNDNSIYGLGQQLGEGNYVVYNGTGNSVTISGLAQGSKYYYAIYEYNSSSLCYLQSPLTGNGTTKCSSVIFPYIEDFEGGSMSGCWTQETESPSWKFVNGNGWSNFTAHNGIYNACLSDGTKESNRNKLISPSFDLTKISNPTLTFWHMQFTSLPNERDELRVYYKTSETGAWKLLATYLDMIPDWTKELINLPEPSDDYYLAFEGDALDGFGVFIDEIKVYAGCEPPTTQASNLSLSNVTSNSMTIGWIRGNGSNVIVLAKAESPVDLSPSNGTTYNANSAFGLGQEIGNGNFVVYNGTGNSVNITGLPAGRKYYFAIYEYYNSSQCYLITNPLNGSGGTICSSTTFPYFEYFEGGRIPDCWSQEDDLLLWKFPNYAGHSGYYYSSISASNKEANEKLITPSFNLTSIPNPTIQFWHKQNVSGTMQNGLRVYYKTSTASDWNLLVSFSENISNWKSEILNLPNPGSDYYIAFDGECSPGNSVSIDDFSIFSGCQPPSTQSENFIVSGITTNSMTIEWTRGNGDGVLILARAGAPVNEIPLQGTSYIANARWGNGQQVGSGNYVVYKGSGTSVNLTNLTPGKDYYYAIYEYNSNSNCYLIVPAPLTGNAITNCPAITYPFKESFENVSGTLPDCWIQEAGPPVWQIKIRDNMNLPYQAHDGIKYIALKDNNSSSNRNKLITPALNLTSVYNPTLKFWHEQYPQDNYFGDDYQDELRIYYKTSASASWNLLTSYTTSAQSWKMETINLPSPSNEYYIAFEGDAKSGYGVFLDDITVESGCTPPTIQATNFKTINISNYSSTINFTRGNGDSVLVLAKEWYEINLSPINGNLYNANNEFGLGQNVGDNTFVVYKGNENSINITGLSPNKKYYFAVFEYNGSSKCYLSPPLKGNLNIPCPTISYPYYEGFEAGMMPGCWYQDDWGNKWNFIQGNGANNPSTSHTGLFNAFLRDTAGSTVKRLVTSSLNLNNIANPALTFWHTQQSNGTNQDELKVYYKSSFVSSWILLASYTNNISEWTEETLKLPEPSNDYLIAFEGYAKKGYGVCIDDVAISPGCASPSIQASNFNVSNLTSNSMTIGWTRGNGNKVLVIAKKDSPVDVNPSYGITYVARNDFGAGDDLGSGNYVVFNGAANFVNISKLLSGSSYHFAIYEYDNSSNCYTNPPLRGNASPLCPSITFPYTETFEDRVIPTCWSQESGPPVWNVVPGNGSTHPSYGHDSQYNVCLRDNSSSSNRNKLISPSLNLSSVSNPTLRFWHTQYGWASYQDELRVYYKTSASGSWNLLASYTDNIKEWTVETINLPNPSNEYYIAFEGDAKNGYGICVDDISIYSGCAAPTVQATNFLTSNVASTNMSAAWTRGNGNNVIVVAKAGSYVDAVPTNGLHYNANSIFGSGQEIENGNFVVYNGPNSSVNITGLHSNINYYFAIYEYNNASYCYLNPPLRGSSSTICNAITFPYTQNFSVWPVTCWDSTGGNFNWKPFLNNAAVAHFSQITQIKNALLTTPVMDFSILSNPQLSFKWSHLYNSNYPDDELKVEISTDGTNWNIIWSKAKSALNSNDGATSNIPGSYIEEKINLVAYSGKTSVKIRFNGISGYGSDLFIDDVTVQQACSGPPITNTTGNSRCGEGSVVLNATTSIGTINWYSSSVGGTSIGTGNSFTTPILTKPTTYFVDVTNNGCITPTRTAISAIINPAPEIISVSENSSCGQGQFILGATANSGTINWYSSQTGGPSIGTGESFTTPVLATTTAYYVDATVDGCSTSARIPVIATIHEPPIITNIVNSSGCSPKSFTLNVTSNRGSVNWYTSPTGGNWLMTGPVFITPVLTNTTSYYVGTSFDGCTSDTRTAVTATILTPTTQASLFSTSSVGTSSMTLGWTRGNGSSVLVVARKGSSVDADPASGYSYTANSVFGSGSQIGSGNYVVYNGTANSVNITELIPNTNYHFAVYEYSTSRCYKTPALTGNASTSPGFLMNNDPVNTCSGTFYDSGGDLGNYKMEESYTKVFTPSIAGNKMSFNFSTFYISYDRLYIYDGPSTSSPAFSGSPFSGSQSPGYIAASLSNTTGAITFRFLSYYTPSTGWAADIACFVPCVQPTTQASSFKSSSITMNSIDISWTRGDGNSVLVVARLGSPVNSVPVDGISYSANSAFGSGSQIGTSNYVVYNGPGTSVNITGLNMNTDYYFAIYEYSATNCFKKPVLTGYAKTLPCTQPTTQATAYTTSSITTNSMNLGWTRGDGSSVLVIAKKGSAVNVSAPDGATYTANAAFGLGTHFGMGNYAVYDGPGTSVNITNLELGTDYYYAIFERSSTRCFKKPALTGYSRTYSCMQPTTQATAFTSYSITPNSMTLGWTRGDGNAVLVIARQGSAVNSVPVDGTVYSANSAFGNGSQIGTGNYVVYNGTGNSVNISSLNTVSGYYFAIYEYSTTNCFKTPALTGSATTICAPPLNQATAFSASGVGIGSMTVGWTRGNGTSVLVVARQGGAVNTDPISGTSYTANAAFGIGTQIGPGNYVVYNGAGNSVNITNLISNTNYYYAVYEYSAPNCYTIPALTGNASTIQGFLMDNNPVTTCSGTFYDSGGSIANYTNNANFTKVFTPLIAGNKLSFNFSSFNTESCCDNLYIYDGPNTSSPAFPGSPFKGTLSPGIITASNSNTTGAITFRFTSDGSITSTGWVADVSCYTPCVQPTTQATAFTSSSITPNSMTLGWTRGDGNAVLVIARQGSAVNSVPVDGTTYTANSAFGSGYQIGTGNYVVYNGPSTSINVTNLVQGTGYYFAIYEYNLTTNCYKTLALIGNATTADCIQPNIQASSFTSSSITTNSMTLGWKRGDGNSILVVARQGSPVNTIPVDGTTYSANGDFGSGTQIGTGNYVVYNGIGTSVSVTGLTPGNTYYFAIYEYNSGTNCYKTPALIGNVTTITCLPIIITVTNNSRCGSGSIILNANSSEGTINWYSAPTGGSLLGSGSSFTTPTLTNTTIYYVDATNNGCTTSTRTAVTATIKPVPGFTEIIDNSICGPGVLTLNASVDNGIINWYDTPTGGNLLGAGSSFTTPNLTSTTTYYVEASDNGCFTPTRTAVVATIKPLPDKPSIPAGEKSLCVNPENQIYTTSDANYANNYIWKLTPINAGTIVGSITSATVDFSNTFTGTAKISVSGENDCAIGESSDSLYIVISSCTLAEEVDIQNLVEIYPNPSDGKVSVKFPDNNQITSFEVINATGKVLIDRNITKKIEHIDLKVSGMYTIWFYSKNKVFSRNVIISN
jgi:M6 family metalloprotease-like protein